MGLLEKLRLVEAQPKQIPYSEDVLYVNLHEAPVSAPVEAEIGTATENIVEEIYSQNGLSDTAESIFMVRALIATLPDEITTPKKQSAVYGILNVSGKSVAALMEDAAKRKETLNAALEKICEQRGGEIQQDEAEIERLKAEIEAANIRIRSANALILNAREAVEREIGEIETLVSFCKGMEARDG